ncbi:DNA/RNA non-specific endonuclease [Shewanella sp. D64]|uniref:DNA/RNA non-specific endonuclease n=1 Tax=unclassified Shewanella TaxID=196818 RepID=UPI0022BA309D|nr:MULTISPECIES: DNA/RNA non-specific endonuclease [unclassified Shewanella]MEC4724297.1 DNA/RNA non-specific endonuclease [Shewanella sp. D64]MEC4738809.1 DNA/RNA non-specific endonuclease [Shewanella sp. E94]WBJ97752.1 DNA/RNA non-specific endonuclease [Shewanella sp. MTB7]
MKKWITLAFLFSVPLQATEFRTPNCPIGCPSLEIKGNVVIFERLYALSQSQKTQFADWVAYEVDVMNFGNTTNRTWKNNPLLEEDERLEKGDYTDASNKLGVDRGHQAPLASFVGSRYWSTLNYLSNITPQAKGLNQGPWKNLEEAVRDAVGFRENLYVITGTLYNKQMDGLPKADEVHSIPSDYYKIVYDHKGNSAAFLMSQSLTRSTDYCTTKKSISDLRQVVPYSLPSKLKDGSQILKRLGC